MSDETFEFDAEILEARNGGALVEIPFSVRDVYGTGAQVRVRATFDGYACRGSIAPMGGRHILGVRKAIRAEIGKDVGDTVAVTLVRDTAPRTVDVPSELATALAADEPARALYDALSFTHRREFAEWVAGAKKDETKVRRAAKAIEMLHAGQTR